MDKIIDYRQLKGNYILVDVRSPGEFEECHIPEAISMPIFTDEERSVVGTIYKQESSEKAKKAGIEIFSRKISDMYEKMYELKQNYKMIVIYCARGGMRSGTISAFFGALGYNVWQLMGGYKGYRAIVNEELPKLNNDINYIVVHGLTGVGKTRILHRLEELGLDILDLEGAAKHRGSLLGSVGIGKQNSQKHFEALVYESIRKRKTNDVFIEAESKRIGKIVMPEFIPDAMKRGRHILVQASLETRAKLIAEEYFQTERHIADFLDGLDKLRRYISNKCIDEYIEMVKQCKFIEVIKELMIKYYDPMYEHTQNNYEYELIVNVDDMEKGCQEIKEWLLVEQAKQAG